MPAEKNYFTPFASQSAATAVDSSDIRLGSSDRRRGQPELSRPGRRVADAIVGIDAERWQTISVGRASSDHLSRIGAHGHGSCAESCRRRTAGSNGCTKILVRPKAVFQ